MRDSIRSAACRSLHHRFGLSSALGVRPVLPVLVALLLGMSPSLVQAQPASSGTLEFGPDPGRVPNFDLLGGYGRQSVSLDDSDTELAGGFVFTFADRDGNIPADEEIRIRGAGWSSVSPVVVSEGTVTANLVDFDLNRADTDEIDQIVVEPAGNYRVDFVSLDLGARVRGATFVSLMSS